MRKMLLLGALCMTAVLVSVAPAMAQSAGPAYDFVEVPRGTEPCPLGLDDVQADYDFPVTCGEGGGYVPAVSDAGATDQYADEASATATASATASASALPETGGVSPGALASFALPTLALLVAGGIFATRIVRGS